MMNFVGKKIGKLKFFAPEDDYGFLIVDGVDRDVWFRFDEVQSGVDDKADLIGQPHVTAEFDLYETKKGFEAKSINFVIEQVSPYKGIRIWEMFDKEGNEVIPENLECWHNIGSINLSRGLRLVFGQSQGEMQVKIIKRVNDEFPS